MREALDGARARTLGLVAHLSDEDLERVVDPIMSPIAWDLGHIAAYEDLWIAPPRSAAWTCCAPTSPRSTTRSRRRARCAATSSSCAAPSARLPGGRARARTVAVTEREGVTDLHELVLRHELQHTETMLQTMVLGGLPPPDGCGVPAPVAGRDDDWIALPAAEFLMGAGPDGFAYDNERPRHLVGLAAFRIARSPRHERDVADVHRGRRLRAPPVVVARGVDVEGGVRHRRLSRRRPHRGSGRARRPRLLVRGRRLRPLGRRSTADRGRVGEGGDLGPGSHGRTRPGLGVDRLGVPRLPGLPGVPVPRVLRALLRRPLSRPARRLVRHAPARRRPTFRNWDLPQRRQLFAGLRLATDHEPTNPPPGGPDDRRRPSRGRPGALAGRRRPRRPHPAVQGAAAQALLRRARLGAVRPDLRAARVLPDPHRAADPRTRGAELMEGVDELVELGRAPRRRRASCSRCGAVRPRATSRSTCRRPSCAAARTSWPTSTSTSTASSATSSATSTGCRAPSGRRAVAFLGGTIGNFPPGSRRRFLRLIGSLLAPGDRLLLGTDLVKDPAIIEAAYNDAAGVTAEFNRNVLAGRQPRAGRRLRPRRVRARRVLRPPARVGRDAPARPRAAGRAIGALGLEVDFAHREELRTEISAKFTSERIAADLAAAGLTLRSSPPTPASGSR